MLGRRAKLRLLQVLLTALDLNAALAGLFAPLGVMALGKVLRVAQIVADQSFTDDVGAVFLLANVGSLNGERHQDGEYQSNDESTAVHLSVRMQSCYSRRKQAQCGEVR